MAVSYNRVILAGNLTRDPELRFTNDGVPVCDIGIAVNDPRSKKEDAVDFFDVSVWRELGETVANYKKKGDPVLVEGKLKYRTWEAEDGSKRSKVSINADQVQFLGRNGNGSGGGGSQETGSTGGESEIRGDVDQTTDFEDIPF